MKFEKIIIFLTIILIIFCLKLMFSDINLLKSLSTCNKPKCECNERIKSLDINQAKEDYSEHYEQLEIVDVNLPKKILQTCVLNYTTSLSMYFLI